jgi:hypothetical protein
MADDSADAHSRTTRRHRRASRRQARFKRIGTIAAVVLVVAAFAAIATETVRFGGDTPTLAGAARVGGSALPATTTTGSGVERPCRSTLTVADPLRLWVGGDSLAGSLGPALGTIAGATGVVQPYFDSRVSSGLMSPGFFDWPDHAATEMNRLKPEIAVFIIGANDYSTPNRNAAAPTTSVATTVPATTSAVAGTPATTSPPMAFPEAWKVDYAGRVENMLSTLEAPGRTVIWVGPPSFKDERNNDGVEQISELSKAVLARHPEAVFVDDYALFLDADGKYADKLPDDKGVLTTMRTGDGVHFTADGGKRLARAVYTLIDAQCHVDRQAVPGVTKTAIETPGSTQVAPGSSNKGGGSIVTTPPATAPPATAPPTTSPPATAAPVTTAAPATTAPPPTTLPATTLPPLPTTTSAGGNPHKP